MKLSFTLSNKINTVDMADTKNNNKKTKNKANTKSHIIRN